MTRPVPTWLLPLTDPRRLESNARALREQRLRERVAGAKCRPRIPPGQSKPV